MNRLARPARELGFDPKGSVEPWKCSKDRSDLVRFLFTTVILWNKTVFFSLNEELEPQAPQKGDC